MKWRGKHLTRKKTKPATYAIALGCISRERRRLNSWRPWLPAWTLTVGIGEQHVAEAERLSSDAQM